MGSNKTSQTCRLIICTILTICLFNCNPNKTSKDVTINLRLEWIPQTQFAGYIVAKQKGYYKDEGLNVNLNPAGPDLKPLLTVANGSDQIGYRRPQSGNSSTVKFCTFSGNCTNFSGLTK